MPSLSLLFFNRMFYDFLNDLYCMFHALYGNVFIRAVESVAAGSEVRTRQPHLAKPGTVGTSAHRSGNKRNADRFYRFVCDLDHIHMILHDLKHIVIAVGYG